MPTKAHQLCQTISLVPSGQWEIPSSVWVLVQILDGIAYWKGASTNAEIPTGSIIMGVPRLGGVVLASSLGGARMRWVELSLDEVSGILPFRGRQRLNAMHGANCVPKVYSPPHAVVGAFNLLFDAKSSNAFLQQCRRLNVFAEAWAESMGTGELENELSADQPRQKLAQWLSRHAESELLEHSIEDMAQMAGCSVRHFSRLFHEETGQSFREKQTELRLRRAQDLLRDPAAKVTQVAMESGYRHIGLFNSLFKKHFGMTPSEWRRSTSSQPRRGRRNSTRALITTASVAVWVLQFSTSLVAQSSVTNAPAKPAFSIQRYELVGNTLLSTSIVEGVLQPFTGPNIDFETVRKGVAALQLEYRERGYVTVSLTLPPQKITNGVIQIQVTEGKLSDIQVTGNKWFSTENVLRSLPSLKTNTFLNGKIFQTELDAANANRDRQIYPQISPGPEPGTSAMVLKVKDQLPLHGRFELSNAALPGTPDLRGNANIQYNNLWQREHSAGIQYGFAPQSFRDKAAWDPFDRPSVASYSAFYRLPLGGPEAISEVVASDPGRFGWDEGSRKYRLPPSSSRSEINIFASRFTLDSGVQTTPITQVNPPPIALYSWDTGRNTTLVENVGARWSKPLPEIAGWRPVVQAGLDLKRFQFGSFNTNNFATEFLATNQVTGEVKPTRNEFPSPQPARSGTVAYIPLTARLDINRPDKLGTTAFGLGLIGNLAGAPFSSESAYQNAGGPDVHGDFIAIQASAFREHKLWRDWTIQLRADGQWTDQSVLSLERFGLVGSQGVRGYQEGSSFGDRGWRVSAEPRTPTWTIGQVDGKYPFQVRGIAFMDFGQNIVLSSKGPDKTETLWGTGVGFSANVGNTIDFRSTFGFSLHRTDKVDPGDYWFYFGIGAQF